MRQSLEVKHIQSNFCSRSVHFERDEGHLANNLANIELANYFFHVANSNGFSQGTGAMNQLRCTYIN